MTGYGRGEEVRKNFESVVEVRSLNHRFLDVAIRLPRGLTAFEESVKEIVRKRILRGRINIAVLLKSENEVDLDLKIDTDTALRYKMLLETLRDKLKIEGAITIDHLLHFPEVLTVETQEELPEEAWECVRGAVERALNELDAMRKREGQEISNDLSYRIGILQERLNDIEARSLARRQEEFQKLHQRLREMIATQELDPNRLELEVALLADRVDVTEECTRFRSHNKVFLETLQSEESSGRKLNFLLQEMNREANTIGAKANDAKIAHWVVSIKEEVERLREQVQNIE